MTVPALSIEPHWRRAACGHHVRGSIAGSTTPSGTRICGGRYAVRSRTDRLVSVFVLDVLAAMLCIGTGNGELR
jgi:hypothetical protein